MILLANQNRQENTLVLIPYGLLLLFMSTGRPHKLFLVSHLSCADRELFIRCLWRIWRTRFSQIEVSNKWCLRSTSCTILTRQDASSFSASVSFSFCRQVKLPLCQGQRGRMLWGDGISYHPHLIILGDQNIAPNTKLCLYCLDEWLWDAPGGYCHSGAPV
jgi:hypothetical protein